MASLIHPRMLSSLEATFYVATCTIQEATETQDAYGQPIPAWANVVGLIDLACSIAPIIVATPQDTERRRSDGILEIASHHIAFPEYYSGIEPIMRAVVDSVVYDILAVEHDSHSAMTRLRVRIVR